ncbi:hypothetical protein GQ53DRAFT_155367 [Thozetella sp. PMI_491]|nr:hypothetical protein GQ53DRAFT_155367 [Thozetella sp. PMI_491]
METPTLSAAQRLQRRISPVYRVFFLWVEPVAAFVGSVMGLATPDDYFDSMSPVATPLAQNPQFTVVFNQLAATYFLFAFNEAVVLRTTSELKVWKAMLFGIACCDLVHIYATGLALGGLHTLVTPTVWRWQDWINLTMLYVPITMRIAFCLGVGIKDDIADSKKTK